VFFKKAFPVDVRHNAKIHRLTLKKEFEKGM
jgi:olefin beta-lactone synthetase